MNPNNKLKLVHWNCNSLYNKQAELYNFFNIFEPDIICLNETKLSKNRFENEIYIKNHPKYKFLHKHRDDFLNGAGGVAIIVRNNLAFSINDELNNLNLELLCITIKLEHKDLYVVAYYNPPDAVLNEQLFSFLSNKHFILIGDLNAKSDIIGNSSSNRNGDILNNILLNNNIICLNDDSYTHISFNKENYSILDLAICSSDLYSNFDSFSCLDGFSLGSDQFHYSNSNKNQY